MNVKPNPTLNGNGASRMGTAHCTLEDLERLFGPKHRGDSGDEKVTATWYFETPRGAAQVGDYWWNRKDEQSIRAANRKAALWLARHLRRNGIPAKCGNWPFSTKGPLP